MSNNKECEFSGYATRCDIRCADGRTIRKGAFKDCDGKIVPLVYNHDHNDVSNVLGHALLEAREDGMYAYMSCNNTPSGNDAREQVMHGDLKSLSIYANHIRQNGNDVIHGNIREVSLVLAGANPGAYIDTILVHSDDDEEEAIIFCGEDGLEIAHADSEPEKKEPEKEPEKKETKEEPKMADNKEKTVGDVLDDIKDKLTDDEWNVFMGVLGAVAEGTEAADDSEDNNDEGDSKEMAHNIFEDNNVIEHGDKDVYVSSEELSTIFDEAKRTGSLKDTFIAHGITDIDYLFPDAKNLDTPPQFIKREDGWVPVVMNGVHKTPFSRIKSTFANITGDEARARGYVKGQQKVSEVITLLKRVTGPTTVYKLQKFDRDDIIDITDFDVISWIKSEMRMMLDEEIARAILVGDGREPGTDYAISTEHIRPIWTDNDLYTVKVPVAVEQSDDLQTRAKKTIKEIIRARKFYKGSGNPVFFTTEDVLTEMLLIEDLNQRIIYDSIDKLATALRVSKIVTVPVMENLSREVSGENRPLQGIIVNLNDYNVGADKGGQVNMFDDFDINYNKLEYLIETRCSGALIKPYSAMAIELDFQ